MNKAEEKRARLLARHPNVGFISGKEKVVRLVFEKSEYRAYLAEKDKWYDMKLGGLDPNVLKDYIVKNY